MPIDENDGNDVYIIDNDKLKIPDDIRYSNSHMWIRDEGEELFRIGITDFYHKLVKDIYFITYDLEQGDRLKRGEVIGSIEGSKSVMQLKSPVKGEIIEFNDELLDDPVLISDDTYGAGWLLQVKADKVPKFMSATKYFNNLKIIADEMNKKK